MRLAERASRAGRSLGSWLDGQGLDLALRLTLLDLLLEPVGRWSVRPFVLILAAMGLLHGGVLRSPALWLSLMGLTGWRVIADWPLADNHAYLLSYWCLAVSLALISRRPEVVLSISARRLIALVFVFAVLWKGLLADDFRDERFFRHLLLTDNRFADISLSLGGISEEDLEEADSLIYTKLHEAERRAPSSLETPEMRTLARVMTWSTLGIETLIALLFLAPRRSRWAALGNYALMAFCVTTYLIAPVPGFGWLLLAMGVAQCPLGARTTRWLYLATFAVVLLHEHIPWLELMRQGG